MTSSAREEVVCRDVPCIHQLLSIPSNSKNGNLCKNQGRRFLDERVDINQGLGLDFVPFPQWPKYDSLAKAIRLSEQCSDQRTILRHRRKSIETDFRNTRCSCEYSNHELLTEGSIRGVLLHPLLADFTALGIQFRKYLQLLQCRAFREAHFRRKSPVLWWLCPSWP